MVIETNFQVHLNVFFFLFVKKKENLKRTIFRLYVNTAKAGMQGQDNTNLWHSFNNVWILRCVVFLISAVNVNFSILKNMDLEEIVSMC